MLRSFSLLPRPPRGWSSSRRDLSTSEVGVVLGVMRETYNLWERRAPLCPGHVKNLIDTYQESGGKLKKVIVQPCSTRVFSNSQYESAGAVVQEDLKEADLILGVKRPLKKEDLLPGKAYSFFSHVIKGQPENMGLLNYVLDNKVQLFDYECIVDACLGSSSKSLPRKSKRLVAFGKFAGRAGLNDSLHALGRRLLHLGYSTPFLHVPPAYIHSDWGDAKRCLQLVGEMIATEGLPNEPLIFCITGRGGKVHSGAMEAIQELPHKILSIEELPSIANSKGPHRCVYVLPVGVADLVENVDGTRFDRERYQAQPDEYVSTFSDRLGKHVSVLVNTAYWNERFPRLLTKNEVRGLYDESDARLHLVADISCDINGSIEFLHRTTSMERPFYEYDPHQDREIIDDVTGEGITVLGVDILPSELPKDSSEFFGGALMPFLKHIIENADANGNGLHAVPLEMHNACIAANGVLQHRFKYIAALMTQQPNLNDAPNVSMILSLEGRLFDSGLINQSLDVIERQDCRFEILECNVCRSRGDGGPNKSLVVLKVSSLEASTLGTVQSQIETLSSIIGAAEATVKRYDGERSKKPVARVSVESATSQNILVLGSGMVSSSAVEYLGRNHGREVVVAGLDEAEARFVASHAPNGKHVGIDILNDTSHLERLVTEADLVVSLLPASFHATVADVCIINSTNLVTASYENDAMRDLGEKAKVAGIKILNEVGLDPGLDHMSAMRLIDDIHERGGTVSRFESYCGGLPSPDVADNPLRYKFSWNPKGVLTASLNHAKYKWNGSVVEVAGESLLSAASPFSGPWNNLDLEYLPNRDALVYMEKYGIHSADTCFRGTLRYAGYSAVMDAYREMGLFRDEPTEYNTWSEMLHGICETKLGRAGQQLDELFLLAARNNRDVARNVAECSEFLGLHDAKALSNSNSILDSFARLLEENMPYQAGEADMVLMHHNLVGSFEHDAAEVHATTLKVHGDENMSAMSKTVGYTTGIAADLMLNGKIPGGAGLLLPTSRDLYVPILDRMSEEQIVFTERSVRLNSCNDTKYTTESSRTVA
jgi:alpha-aminoadipic semialdehyde synthase